MSPKPKDSYVPPDEIDGKKLSPAMKKYLKDNPQHRGDGFNAKLYRGVNELGDKAVDKLKKIATTNPRTGYSSYDAGAQGAPANKLKEKNKMAQQNRRDAAAAEKEANKTEESKPKERKKSNFSGDFNESFGRSKDAEVARGANNRSKKVLTAEERMKGSKYDNKEFGTAFKAARKAGMKGFMHGGKKYNTKTEEEKDSGRKMSAPAEKATRKNQASSTYGKKKKPNVNRSEAKSDNKVKPRQTKLKGMDKDSFKESLKPLKEAMTSGLEASAERAKSAPKKTPKKRSKPDNFYGTNKRLKGAGGQMKAALSNLFGGRK